MATATSTGADGKGRGAYDGKATAFAFENPAGETLSWTFVGVRGVDDEVPEPTVRKILGTVGSSTAHPDLRCHQEGPRPTRTGALPLPRTPGPWDAAPSNCPHRASSALPPAAARAAVPPAPADAAPGTGRTARHGHG
ncbi:hypothetical protein ACWD7B_10815 [Streptomyces rubiginosohelvolus]